jgi:hypothetical protein
MLRQATSYDNSRLVMKRRAESSSTMVGVPGDLRARRWDRVWWAGAILALWVFHSWVSFSFAPARIQLADNVDATTGTVSLPLTIPTDVSGGYLVATCRLHNREPHPITIDVRLGSRLLASRSVGAAAVETFRVAWSKTDVSSGDALAFTGSSTNWTLETAQLSNRFGFSRGLLNLEVVPAGQSFPRTPVGSLVLLTLVLIVVGLVGTFPLIGWQHVLALAGAMIGWLVLSAVAIAPIVSRFAIVLSPRTFALCLLLVSGSRLAWMADRASSWFGRTRARHRAAVVACGALTATFFASAVLQTLARYDGNYSGLLHIARDFAQRAPFLQERPALARSLFQYDFGYDGQFAYMMAFDPFLTRFSQQPQRYRDVVDLPPYRYGRVGFSVLTRWLAAGRPEYFPATMVWLIVGAQFVLGWSLASIARSRDRSPWSALLCVTIPGFMASTLFALPEPIAAAAVVSGLFLLERDRLAPATICFGGALLIRETSVLLVAAAIATSWRRLGWRSGWPIAVGALGPMVAWRLYVGWRLMPDFGITAFLPEPGDLTLPFAGLSTLFVAGLRETQPAPEIAAARVFPFLLIGGLALSLWLVRRKAGPMELATAAYGMLAVSLNYGKIWSHVPSGERGTFELFLGLLLLFFASDAGSPASLGSNSKSPAVQSAMKAFFVTVCLYTFLLSPEAGTSRAALLLVR